MDIGGDAEVDWPFACRCGRIGLADVVFPAFLFIVGLYIPFAIRSRLKKGDSKPKIAVHIALRALALIIMGVFHVNLGHYPQDAHIPKAIWQILITLGAR